MYSKPDVFADSVLKGFPPPSALLAAHQVEKTTFSPTFFCLVKLKYIFSIFFSRSFKMSHF